MSERACTWRRTLHIKTESAYLILHSCLTHTHTHTYTHPTSPPPSKKTQVLDLKWRMFGLKLFCVKEIWFNLHLVLFLFEHNSNSEDRGGECADGNPDPALRHALIALSGINLVLQVLFTGKQLHEGKVYSLGSVRGVEITVPRSLANAWLWLRMATWVTLIVIYSRFSCEAWQGNELPPCLTFLNGTYAPAGCAESAGARIFSALNLSSEVRFGDDGGLEWSAEPKEVLGVSADRALISIAGLTLWAQVLQCSVLSAHLSAFTFSLGIMLHDLSHSLFFIALLLLAFGSSLSIIKEDPYDEGFDGTLLKLMYEVLGVSSYNYAELSDLSRHTHILKSTPSQRIRPYTL